MGGEESGARNAIDWVYRGKCATGRVVERGNGQGRDGKSGWMEGAV